MICIIFYRAEGSVLPLPLVDLNRTSINTNSAWLFCDPRPKEITTKIGRQAIEDQAATRQKQTDVNSHVLMRHMRLHDWIEAPVEK